MASGFACDVSTVSIVVYSDGTTCTVCSNNVIGHNTVFEKAVKLDSHYLSGVLWTWQDINNCQRFVCKDTIVTEQADISQSVSPQMRH